MGDLGSASRDGRVYVFPSSRLTGGCEGTFSVWIA
jgi:hypothetical protein